METSKHRPKNSVVFKFTLFSKKQKQVLSWWENPKYKDKEAIICDGSVRAGKTVIMSLSYIIWAMAKFDEEQFGMAGKTIGSLRRNIIRHHWLKLEWIDKLTEKNAIRIHFTMEDNPSLSQKVIDRFKQMYSGVFYDRFIRGLWVLSEGIIYDNFDKEMMN